MPQSLFKQLNIRAQLFLLCILINAPLLALFSFNLWKKHQELTMLILALGAVSLSFLVALIATRHFTRTINELVRKALLIGKGNFSTRITASFGGELGTLAKAFNEMATQLEIDREHKQLTEQISRSIRQSLELEQILNTTVFELGQALKASRCCLALIDEQTAADLSGKHLTFDHIFLNPFLQGTPLINRHVTLSKGGLLKSFIEQSSILSLDVLAGMQDIFESADYLHDWQSIKSLLACPIYTQDRPLGLILVHQCNERKIWSASELELVEAIADQVAIAINQASLFAQVKLQSITDGLTGLYNHSYFKNRLHQEIRRAQRNSGSCSLLMIDLDKLKEINDTFGHPAGDTAITKVSEMLKNLLRTGDIAARYGGEEFTVILPDTNLSMAKSVGERLCKLINQEPVEVIGHISVSIGAACFPENANDLEQLIDNADKGLYLAKRSGRNQVRTYLESQILHLDMNPDTIESHIIETSPLFPQ